MTVTRCDIPAGSALDQDLIRRADYHDSFKVAVRDPDQSVVELFSAIFGHLPLPMKWMLIARNALARLIGLEAPSAAEIMNVRVSGPYAPGDKIGVWPVFALTETELIAGRDNWHMDFRLSVLKQSDTKGSSVVVTTICSVNNLFGRIYLTCIIPFHRYGVRRILANAAAAGRL